MIVLSFDLGISIKTPPVESRYQLFNRRIGKLHPDPPETLFVASLFNRTYLRKLFESFFGQCTESFL